MKKHEDTTKKLSFGASDGGNDQVSEIFADIFGKQKRSVQEQELSELLRLMEKDKMPETPLLSEKTWARMHAAIAMQNPVNKQILSERQHTQPLDWYHLLESQLTILPWKFLCGAGLFFVLAIMLFRESIAVGFLLQGAPFFSLLVLFYTYRSELYGMAEIEASCPYTALQIAGGRIFITFFCTILLCLLATSVLILGHSSGMAQEKMKLWKIILLWIAPLVFYMGISLTVSLKWGIMRGCCTAWSIWGIQFAAMQIRHKDVFLMGCENPLLVWLLLGIGMGLLGIYFYSATMEAQHYSV